MTELSKSRGLRPDFYYSRVIDIQPDWLKAMNVRGLLLDIDNTITRWENLEVPPPEMDWLEQLKKSGIKARLLSNGLARKKKQVTRQTGIGLITPSLPKPTPTAFLRGLTELELPPEYAMMIGDSVFTDIAGANRVGIWTALVDPLSHIDFIGSKAYRLLESVLSLRRPVHHERDYRTHSPETEVSDQSDPGD